MNIQQFIKRSITWVLSSLVTVAVLFIAINVAGGNTVSESTIFFWRMLNNPRSVGAVAPTSSAAAEALIAKISASGGNRRLIETGAGTGSITQELVKRLQPGDMLDVIELDEDLAKILQQKFGHHPQVSVHQVSITDWKPSYKYDALVTAIPFSSFGHDLTKDIWLHQRKLMKPGAPVSYIAYIGFPSLRGMFLTGREKADYQSKMRFLNGQFEQFGIGKTEVMANLPPANVYYMAF